MPSRSVYKMKQKFDVTGMTCAACSSRVDKVTREVDGVEDVVVNLLKNSMEVEFDGRPEVIAAIERAVEHAGYGATPAVEASVGQAGAPSAKDPGAAAREAARKMRTRLIVSIIFVVPLFYLCMGHMFGWPIPPVFHTSEGILPFAFTQFLLLLPIIGVNFSYFTTGFSSLLRGSPNMNSLIALGSAASTIYGIYGIYRIGFALGLGDMSTAHSAAMDLYFESAGMILALITLGKYFESRAKGRTTDAIVKLMDLSPKTAIRRAADGTEEEIPVDRVCVGDILVVKSGMGVPVDGTVVEGSGSVDESAITGEGIPVEKTVGSTVIGATVSRSGWFAMRAEHVGDDTAIAGIIRMVDDATSSKAPIEKVADRISGIFVPCVIAIAVVTFIVWMALGGGLETAMSHAVTVLVISCPCALGLATPTAIMVGTGRGASRGILVKSADALQRAHSVSTVIMDKTGTITTGHPRVTDVVSVGGGSVKHAELVGVAASLEGLSEHPLAQAICDYADSIDAPRSDVSDFSQTPGRGIAGTVSGEAWMAGNERMMREAGVELGNLPKVAESLADDGKTPLFFSKDGIAAGIIAVADVVKPSSERAVSELSEMGIDVVMLTGDNERTARAVQRQCGISRVVAGVLPADKAAEVSRLSETGTVAMVGDGINDAPALATADVGIAIGAGTDIAMESADMVLMRSDLLDVPVAIQLSRATMRNIKQNLFWALFYNAICIPLAAGALSAFGINLNPMIAAAAMSLSSICVVGNALRLRAWKPRVATVSIESSTDPGESATEMFAGEVRVLEIEPASASESIEVQSPAPTPAALADVVKDASDGAYKDEAPERKSTMTKTIDVTGMMCQNCVKHVTHALEGIDGVSSVEVDLDAGTAICDVVDGVADDILVAAIVDAGYEAKIR